MEQDFKKEEKSNNKKWYHYDNSYYDNHKISTDGKNIIVGTLSLIVFIGVGWYFVGGGLETQTAKNMDDIYQKVASDAVEQYRIAERQGDKIQICVQAGLVSASYLQAKDESSYRNWKDIEDMACKRAGLTQ